jgi:ribose-phosphate pyrophosphokinase
VHDLQHAAPVRRAVALTATPAMSAFLAARGVRPLLVGPDLESEQWVRSVAAGEALDFVVAEKVRRGDREVEVRLPSRDYRGVHAVVVDDLASTGRTLVETVRALRGAGAGRVDVLVTHALFVGDAMDELARAGVSAVWSSDSVEHSTNAFSLAPMLARAIE